MTLVVLTCRVSASIGLNLLLHYILKIFSEWRGATWGQGRSLLAAILSPEVFWIVIYFIILVYFCPPNARFPPSPLKYFYPTIVCFLVAALAEGHGDLEAESPVSGALSCCRKNCNLWDCMNPNDFIQIVQQHKVLSHRFRTLSIGPKSFSA